MNIEFYSDHYQQGSTTEMPDSETLAQLVATNFSGTERDFSSYVGVLDALGIKPGATILDFGCSWGYGSWQLRQAGYRVYSQEIAPNRARYAAERLGCKLIESSDELVASVDCLVAVHVIEHMPTPAEIWNVSDKVLKPGGLVALFMPNGDPYREYLSPRTYHQAWGKVHPLLLTADALRNMARLAGFDGLAYSSPYDLAAIAQRLPGETRGPELAFISWRSRAT